MIRKTLFLPMIAASAIAILIIASSVRTTDAQQPGPSAGSVLVGGLLQPKGLEVGPDGFIYIAESGTGGDTDFTLDGQAFKNGYTGRISKVDADSGARTTVVEGLPSNASVERGEAVGPADVAFIGSTLYYLQTHAGDAWGFDDFETGIYRVDDNGDLTLVADIGAFNASNPVAAITSGTQVDVEPGGNPYAMEERNGALWVSDGNHNRLMRVETNGAIEEITEFPDHPVSTGLDFGPNGTPYVAYLGQAPFFPEDGKVVTVNPLSGAITEVASGQPWMTDVEFGPGGKLYGTQFNNQPALEESSVGPFQGTVLTVNDDGTMSPLVTGLSFPTFIEFDGETAYVTNWSVTPMGEIVKIQNFSSVEPPAAQPAAPAGSPTQPAGPAPTATPGGGSIGAPDTGDGSATGGTGSSAWLIVAATAAAGTALTLGGARLARRRR